MRPRVALDGCRIWRPGFHADAVEVVCADARPRAFPTRLSQTLGVGVKAGGSHAVRADAKNLIYPADAICIRPPGCIWSSEPASVGFLSVDIASEWLRGYAVRGNMVFGAARHLPDLVAVVRRLARATSSLETEVVLADLISSIVDAGVLAVREFHDDGGGARGTRRARDFLTARAYDNPTLDEVARQAGMNKFVLVRWFRRLYGITPHAYLMAVRTDRARTLLAAGTTSAEASVIAGFADQAHFSRWFKRLVGITPGSYARQTRAFRRSISFKTSPLVHG